MSSEDSGAPTMTQPHYPIRTQRLRLRPVVEADTAAINGYRSLPAVARYLPHPPQSMQDTALTVKSMAGQSALTQPGQWLDLAVEHGESGQLVGEVLLKWDAENSQCGEIGFVFGPEVQGQGVAFEASTAALELAFNDFGWHRVEGICDARNQKSATLMGRLGMRAEARFVESDWSKGEWVSLLHYAVLRREWLARA
ncbi:GNAT family N-acetyltransferase [Arthrobacter alpinus]|nr:GNAT family protein [Arthrobacter alpinus]